MDFIQAQSMARGGKKMRRAKWSATRAVLDSQGTLQVLDERGFASSFNPTAEDREATDWSAVEDADLTAAQEKAAAERDAKDETAKAALSTASTGGISSEPTNAEPPKSTAKAKVEGSRK